MKKTQSKGLPPAFVSRIQQDLGAEAAAFLEALAGRGPVSLRLNPAKPGAHFEGASPIPWADHGLFLPERPSFFLDPYIYAGGYYVQEASSMLIGQYVERDRPLRVLDLCAAPGGKSTLIASLLHPGSLLISNEMVGSRARILCENMDRWGWIHGAVSCNAPRDFGGLTHFFDLIVVDAPCSGEGMFRKDPDTMAHWSPRMVQQCAQRQQEILEAITPCLKPGGRLIYSTCTYNTAENEAVVRWLLDRDPGAWDVVQTAVPDAWGLTPGDPAWGDEMAHVWHCYPHRVQGEGFFLACLEKQRESRGAAPTSSKKPRMQGRDREAQTRQRPAPRAQDIRTAATPFLADPLAWEYLSTGEELWALPEADAEALRHAAAYLRLIRLGLPLGRLKGGSLIPEHGLALAPAGVLHPDLPRLDLDYENAMRFLKRMEPDAPVPAAREWILASWKGLGLGWLKAVGTRLNVHLPKELRIRADISDITGM